MCVCYDDDDGSVGRSVGLSLSCCEVFYFIFLFIIIFITYKYTKYHTQKHAYIHACIREFTYIYLHYFILIGGNGLFALSITSSFEDWTD